MAAETILNFIFMQKTCKAENLDSNRDFIFDHVRLKTHSLQNHMVPSVVQDTFSTFTDPSKKEVKLSFFYDCTVL